MKSTICTLLVIAGALLLGACSGVSSLETDTCYSDGCQSYDGHTHNTLNLGGGSGLGSSFNSYSTSLLHD